ncbi:MAG: hypothetical protein ACE5FZ_02640 [Nitrospiria bacterium]
MRSQLSNIIAISENTKARFLIIGLMGLALLFSSVLPATAGMAPDTMILELDADELEIDAEVAGISPRCFCIVEFSVGQKIGGIPKR